MTLMLLAPAVMLASGIAALLCVRHSRRATWFGAGGVLAGALLGAVPALRALLGYPPDTLRLAWGLPFGSFAVGLDPLSAWFVLPVLGLCAVAGVYGTEYLQSSFGRMRLALSWFFFDVLAASMLLVLMARDGLLFLIAWEVMSLASYFLVTMDDEDESVRRAGWTYLVATHLGTAFLMFFFFLLGRQCPGFDLASPARLSGPLASGAFLLALVGFGTKAGLVPMHVWLPEAHPAAPSHVSAVMSGVMIKTGIYGLMRAITILGAPPAWWGWCLLALGAWSGISGVLLALAQRDLKRLLAYSSVDNIGILVMGLGVGLLGRSYGLPLVSFLGFGGALLHVLNHALFKGLLFLGAGSVLHSEGTRDMEHMGGLLQRMPWTGACFLVGSAAICGLPPLNGFVSEFLIYLAGFHAVVQGHAQWGALVIAALALIGGLAVVCFAKAFGVVFLGEPRGARAAAAHEAGWAMRSSMLVLAVGCVWCGLAGPGLLYLAGGALAGLSGMPAADLASGLDDTMMPLAWVSAAGACLILLVVLLVSLRSWLFTGRKVAAAVTWDCGYIAPTARMQYTAASFSQPVVELFGFFLRTHEHAKGGEGYFPGHATFASETPDIFRDKIFRPLFAGVLKAALKMRWVQLGRIQVYILYIALTLLILLAWKLG
ncbi:MAG: proton-conducting transporter membrane subunit [Elusimicrobiota bacterium]|jgi:formate hydrogenlyase subunit 3/multisubunit Na+/H+ antiporter MnhD subunit